MINTSQLNSTPKIKTLIRITPNNCIIALIDNKTNSTIAIISSGHITPKPKGRKKLSDVVLEQLSAKVLKFLRLKKSQLTNIEYRGTSHKRKKIVQYLIKNRIRIHSIVDKTPVPHNGCSLSKIRRL